MKGTLDRRQAEAPLVAAALARSPSTTSPGTRYLEQRRIRANVGQELSAWLTELFQRIAAQLREHAAEFRERAVGPNVSDNERTPILNWAFLIASGGIDDFQACVERINTAHAERGVVLECSGPWPPYSFCPALDVGHDVVPDSCS